MKLRYKIANGFLVLLVVAISALAITLSYTSDCGPAPAVAEDAELMKAIVYRCYGSPDVLEFSDVAKPAPADDEVLVKVHTASINPLDWHYMRGWPYVMRLGSGLGAPTETRLGVDFAGTVEAIGKNVTGFKPGDEVFGGRKGALAEYVTKRADRGLALKPANVTFEQAASAPIAAVTALQALRDRGKIEAGTRVLINGASGGVGTFAVQIAKSFGAEVTGVCSTRNVDMVRSIGADHVFDYKTEDYTQSGKQYDLIIDNVGNHSLSANRRVLSRDGILVIIGGSKGNWLGPFVRPIAALLVSPFVDQELGMMLAEIRKEDLATLADLMQRGLVTPVIDRRYALSEAAAAIRYSEEGHARGKIIVEIETAAREPLATGTADMGTDAFVRHMHMHSTQLERLDAALAARDLDAAYTPAYWLSRHEGMNRFPNDWQMHLEKMRVAARAVEDAPDVDAALAAAQGIAESCHGCHTAAGVDVPGLVSD